MTQSLPSVTYILRFIHTNGNVELVHHNTYDEAKEHYDLFDDSDADVYNAIELIWYEWISQTAKLVQRKTLS